MDLVKTSVKISVDRQLPVGYKYEGTRDCNLFLLLLIVVYAHQLPYVLFIYLSIL